MVLKKKKRLVKFLDNSRKLKRNIIVIIIIVLLILVLVKINLKKNVLKSPPHIVELGELHAQEYPVGTPCLTNEQCGATFKDPLPPVPFWGKWKPWVYNHCMACVKGFCAQANEGSLCRQNYLEKKCSGDKIESNNYVELYCSGGRCGAGNPSTIWYDCNRAPLTKGMDPQCNVMGTCFQKGNIIDCIPRPILNGLSCKLNDGSDGICQTIGYSDYPYSICKKSCSSDNDCTIDRPYCDADIGVCNECRKWQDDCKSPGKPACNDNGDCVECLDDDTCQRKNVNKPKCDLNEYKCVECISKFDCAYNPKTKDKFPCYLSECVECVNSPDCPDSKNPVCSDGNKCVPCIKDSDCPSPKKCKGGECFNPCSYNADCFNPTPSCKNGLCVPCIKDSDCSGSKSCVDGNCDYYLNGFKTQPLVKP